MARVMTAALLPLPQPTERVWTMSTTKPMNSSARGIHSLALPLLPCIASCGFHLGHRAYCDVDLQPRPAARPALFTAWQPTDSSPTGGGQRCQWVITFTTWDHYNWTETQPGLATGVLCALPAKKVAARRSDICNDLVAASVSAYVRRVLAGHRCLRYALYRFLVSDCLLIRKGAGRTILCRLAKCAALGGIALVGCGICGPDIPRHGPPTWQQAANSAIHLAIVSFVVGSG